MEYNFGFFMKLKTRGETTRKIIMKHPEFLVMEPGKTLFTKIKIFESYDISIDQQSNIIKECPEIYLKSVASLETKMKYL